jgi:hypothetical protein
VDKVKKIHAGHEAAIVSENVVAWTIAQLYALEPTHYVDLIVRELSDVSDENETNDALQLPSETFATIPADAQLLALLQLQE